MINSVSSADFSLSTHCFGVFFLFAVAVILKFFCVSVSTQARVVLMDLQRPLVSAQLNLRFHSNTFIHIIYC